MPVEKITISRDDTVYECFPHLCRTRSGRILLAYRESNGHVASELCRLIVRHSDDGGHTWSDRHVIADEKRNGDIMGTWNCPKIQQLKDGRILLLCDIYDYPPGEWGVENDARIVLWYSNDAGESFSDPQQTPVGGICPDQVTEMPDGRYGLPSRWRVDMSDETWAKRIAKRGIVIPKVPDCEPNARFINRIERGPWLSLRLRGLLDSWNSAANGKPKCPH